MCFLLAWLLTVLLALAAGLLALRGRRRVLGGVYLLLAVLMTVPGSALTLGPTRTLG